MCKYKQVIFFKNTVQTLKYFNLKRNLTTPVNSELISINKTDSQLGYYLAGLIESDGSIIVPSEGDSTPTIKIVFQIKDLPLAEKIKEVLGYGSIQKTKSDLAIELFIRNKKGIINLTSLINGKLRTPKISQFHKLID
jgi:hypothetical protein